MVPARESMKTMTAAAAEGAVTSSSVFVRIETS